MGPEHKCLIISFNDSVHMSARPSVTSVADMLIPAACFLLLGQMQRDVLLVMFCFTTGWHSC